MQFFSAIGVKRRAVLDSREIVKTKAALPARGGMVPGRRALGGLILTDGPGRACWELTCTLVRLEGDLGLLSEMETPDIRHGQSFQRGRERSSIKQVNSDGYGSLG